jgi:hypothetical protein
MKWCFFWPFGFSPCNHNVAAAEYSGVLSPIVLDNTLKSKRPGGLLAVVTVAEEQIPAMLFC